MKSFSTFSLIMATWAAVVMSGGAHSSPAQPPVAAVDCSPMVFGMMECMGFLAVGGTEMMPQATCCSGFQTLVEANADCVCDAFTAAANFGIAIDMSRAHVLPLICGVATPTFATCYVADSPNGSPAEGAPLLPPRPSAISASPSTTFGAPAPAPSSSSSVIPAIFLNFPFVVSVLFFIYA